MIDTAARDAFRLTADPTFFWRHGQYAHAFDALRAAVLAGDRFAVLTGEAGTGKTTLLNALGQSLADDGVFVGRLMYGRIEPDEMWSALVHAFRLDDLESRDAFASRARAALCTVSAGARAAVLTVDEAHMLAPDALAELERLADVLSAGDGPMLSVLLVGMPELSAHLESLECARLCQRIGTSVQLVELSEAEVAAYIRHRLEIASANPELLPGDVVGRIATASRGTPALINEMCHAFVAGFDAMPEPITAPPRAWPGGWFRMGLGVAGVAGLVVTIVTGVQHRNAAPPPAAVPAPAEPIAGSGEVTPPPAVEQPISSPAAAQPSPAPSGPVAAPERTPAQVPPSVTRRPAAPAASAPSRSAVTKPRPQNDEPDPGDVIDWLMKEGSARR